MIIDVRPNTGGDETLGRVLAARFMDQDVDYALTELGPPKVNSTRYPRKLLAANAAHRFPGQVRVLIGGGNLSSTEAFIMMMQKAPRAKLIGAKTYGSSGNPKPIALGNGVTVNMPSWRAFSVDGKPLEGNGIEPDLVVEWPGKVTVKDGDPVIKAALSSF